MLLLQLLLLLCVFISICPHMNSVHACCCCCWGASYACGLLT
jgi:hypothetical protein